jgi:hypothetical protein
VRPDVGPPPQKCSRFQALEEFHGAKRTCAAALIRRRKRSKSDELEQAAAAEAASCDDAVATNNATGEAASAASAPSRTHTPEALAWPAQPASPVSQAPVAPPPLPPPTLLDELALQPLPAWAPAALAAALPPPPPPPPPAPAWAPPEYSLQAIILPFLRKQQPPPPLPLLPLPPAFPELDGYPLPRFDAADDLVLPAAGNPFWLHAALWVPS